MNYEYTNNIGYGKNNYNTIFFYDDSFQGQEYLKANWNTHNNKKERAKRYGNTYDEDVVNRFNEMQEEFMRKEIPILTSLLNESQFDSGYESEAEKYYNELCDKYKGFAGTILENIYFNNMNNNPYLLKHLMFIVANLPKEKRNTAKIIPLAALSNPDIEVKDLAVRCFEFWEDKNYLPTLIELRNNIEAKWLVDYIDEVIGVLEED